MIISISYMKMTDSGPFDDIIPEESGAYSGDVFDAEKIEENNCGEDFF